MNSHIHHDNTASTSHAAGQLSESAQALQAVASALLGQAINLLHELARLTPEEGERILTHESTYIPGSTIGKHLRHSLDHYRLLLDAVPSTSAASGVMEVNYDTRVRMLDMEKSPQAAVRSFEEMDKKLANAVAATDLDQDVRLTALTPYHQEFGTTFGRELWFVALHAIHHFSLLRVIATGELGLKLPDNFGVAPSTLAFREYSKASEEKDVPPQKMEQGAEKMASKVKL